MPVAFRPVVLGCQVLTLGIICLFALPAIVRAGEEVHSDLGRANALLRGVVEARESVPSGRFQYSVAGERLKGGHRLGMEANVQIGLLGKKLRLEQTERCLVVDSPAEEKLKVLAAMNYDKEAFVKKGLGTWQVVDSLGVFDGAKLISTTDPKTGIWYYPASSPDAGGIGLFLNPRTLGLAPTDSADESVERCLKASGVKELKCLGSESIDGKDAWHVVLVFPAMHEGLPVERHLWIGDQSGFPVYRSITGTSKFISVQFDCKYEADTANKVFPIEVVEQVDFRPNGQPRFQRHYQQTHAEYGVAIDESAFTLVGIGMRPGASITDTRLHQVVGYWDGERIVMDINVALRGNASSEVAVAAWYWCTIPGVVLLALGLWLWLRRRTQLA